MPQPVRIVGSVLVRNEDLFVERALRNAVAFCDRIHAFDHVSDDDTWEILRSLAREYDHLEVRRTRHSGAAHAALERYAGTPAWVIGIDGDELFDPAGLARLREALLAGEHADVFRVKAHVLNCDELDSAGGTASGWLAPPSRPVTKLFNYGAVTSWTDSPDPLQAGNVAFRDGYHWELKRDLAASTAWEDDPLRLLHVCFVRRSSRDRAGEARQNLDESRRFRRDAVGALKRALRSGSRGRDGRNWKREWYARGERVTLDASPFLA